MVRIAGNSFTKPWAPLLLRNRAFLLEPGAPLFLSAVLMGPGEPRFEILKNRPMVNDQTGVVQSEAGV